MIVIIFIKELIRTASDHRRIENHAVRFMSIIIGYKWYLYTVRRKVRCLALPPTQFHHFRKTLKCFRLRRFQQWTANFFTSFPPLIPSVHLFPTHLAFQRSAFGWANHFLHKCLTCEKKLLIYERAINWLRKQSLVEPESMALSFSFFFVLLFSGS